MRYASKAASLAPLIMICAACSALPSNICEMPANRHFWQGVDVSWSGEIIDIMAPPHGGGIYFTDYRCGTIVELDPGAVPSLYSSAEDWSGHVAVARFSVSGHLSYKNGGVVLRPKSLERMSNWMIDDEFDAYMEKRRATSIEKGLLAIPEQ